MGILLSKGIPKRTLYSRYSVICVGAFYATRLKLPNLALIKYELRLVASDNLNENYTTIVIHVNDVNDNPPVFDRPTYETQITEEDDRSLPKSVLRVKLRMRHSSIASLFACDN